MDIIQTSRPHAPIFLIGYMACGKTTFGRALARRIGWQFVDLDFYIEQRFRKSVSDIFAERGEEGFRRIEAQMLHEVGEFEDTVVACGGGTPCFCGNMDYMKEAGMTVWLDATIGRITERLARNRSKRPLMADKTEEELYEAVEKGLESRREFYARADIRFPGDELEDRHQIDRSLDRFMAIMQ